MRFKAVHLENFRNYDQKSFEFKGAETAIIGPNGMGKTNLLEALSLVSSLKSFRTKETKHLIRHGQTLAQLRYEIEHPKEGECELLLRLQANSKQVVLNGTPIKRIGELVGLFPTVTLHSEDLQLIRGAPALRRRYLDYTLSFTSPGYFEHLRSFHQALGQRNALLRRGRFDEASLRSFDVLLAEHALPLHTARVDFCAAVQGVIEQSLEALSDRVAGVELVLQSSVGIERAEDFLEHLSRTRKQDEALGHTSKGPHRDDWVLKLSEQSARQFASEGQQRLLALALELAQAALIEERMGVSPVILADDVLAPLDEGHRERVRKALQGKGQLVLTAAK